MVGNASSTAEAWGSYRKNARHSVHNRVQLRRHLNEFKLLKAGNILEHFLKFDALCMSIQATGQ